MGSLGSQSAARRYKHPTANIAPWLNEPYVQEPVIAALKAAPYPLALREVAEAAGVPLRPANRVLGRLHKKGLVGRHKLALQRHAICRKTWKIVPNAARRMLFVYWWAGEPAP